MTPLISLGTVPIDPAYAVAAGAALALALVAWRKRHARSRTEAARSGTLAVCVASLAALGCTIYSADTSWRFAADYLDMAGTTERAMMFGAAELALFATALMARQNLATQGAPGLPGGLVWVITGVQVIPAYAESGPVGGTVRAFVGPVLAAMLWHLAMGIELRLRKPDAASQGVLATLGREMRERLFSRLGLAARNRNAAQITRDRATARAVTLASRLASLAPDKRKKRRGQRTVRRLEASLARSGVGTDPEQRRALLDQLAARRHAAALATVDLPSPWSHPSRDRVEDRREQHPAHLHPDDLEAFWDQLVRWLRSVPDAGPEAGDQSIGDRPDAGHAGPAAGTEAGVDGDREPAGDRADKGGWGLPGGTDTAPIGDHEDSVPGTDEAGDDAAGRASDALEVAAQGTTSPSPTLVPNKDGDQDRPDSETGTEPGGDRPHTVPNDDGDQDRPDTETGTEPGGDRPHTLPVRRKPKSKGPRNRPGGGQTKRTRTQQLTVDQMVERVRPHVPALLERDGNESLTRVQLREILRAQNLQGGRNERLTPVLQQLRNEASTTTTRSTTR
ncbi:hypothetical protein [Streptomyces silvisoli]|uniref:DUF2637 domain-containing protein n=1 Tax=Streptomyces silvisoli TaxID=3034235 RepID=A0ABT5ZK14_9ACTN|nr:hypothetical protein [Streptomyces silvisoli]MDF3290176.1 hypothetical protein [Streptomyces silvisoli]